MTARKDDQDDAVKLPFPDGAVLTVVESVRRWRTYRTPHHAYCPCSECTPTIYDIRSIP